ncbi:acetate kinase [Candidatus Peregrinibacteria bacterium]|nr:acetate kinase [Candidatus Peregrinibacteria bacterium]
MLILVINAGSSSMKFQLMDSGKNFTTLVKGIVDRLGQEEQIYSDNKGHKETTKIESYSEALDYILKHFIKHNVIKSFQDIKAVGHRVVHGGEAYKKPTVITPKVLKTITELSSLAPLHNPPNIEGIKACKKVLPTIPQVAVFDTSFHQTMPEKAFLYALPLELYKKHNIRRYGFHGTSHTYVLQQALKILNKKNAKVITCHLGNGCSVTATRNGKSVDTSMGFTPLEGLMMGTRCGDLDPALPLALIKTLKTTPEKIDQLLNRESGLKGISGKYSDMRDIWATCKKDSKSKLAMEIYCYRIAKYIGAYAAALNGVDAIAFTAGIGENAWYVRKMVCDYLTFLGLALDKKKNLLNKPLITTPKSKVKVLVIPTNEEKEIAQETAKLLKNK